MTAQLNRMPTYSEALTTKGTTTRGWYQFFAGLWSGQPTGQLSALSVGPSPFSYVAPVGGSVLISGGSTTQIQLSRDGMNFYVTGVTSGVIPVSQGDTLKVTFPTSVPTMVMVPK